jgi:hypothetical protein
LASAVNVARRARPVTQCYASHRRQFPLQSTDALKIPFSGHSVIALARLRAIQKKLVACMRWFLKSGLLSLSIRNYRSEVSRFYRRTATHSFRVAAFDYSPNYHLFLISSNFQLTIRLRLVAFLFPSSVRSHAD